MVYDEFRLSFSRATIRFENTMLLWADSLRDTTIPLFRKFILVLVLRNQKASPVSGQAKVAMTFNFWNPRQVGLSVVKVLSFSLFPVTVMGIDCFGCV